MSRLFWLISFLGFILCAHADEPTAGKRDGSYFAHAEAQASSEVEAKDEACNRAKKELIAYIFGLQTKVKSSVVITNDTYSLNEQVNVNSDWLQLKGIRQTAKVTTDTEELATATCTLNYPEADANREIERVKKVQQVLAEKKLNKVTFENGAGLFLVEI